jgi:predicted RNA-binding Zn-ribbon protein involved in translation (DUF1610 family)
MAGKFNCPNCGAPNQDKGEGDTIVCAYCGQDIHPPEEMVNKARVLHLSSQAKTWIILFVIVVFVLPTCISFGGTIIGVLAAILGTIAAFVAALLGG